MRRWLSLWWRLLSWPFRGERWRALFPADDYWQQSQDWQRIYEHHDD